uniref:NADAR domain-containing protein n=1 Tax=Ditylenchus dipsaci TaxID=166011 RepID=A0A915D4L4_9BILA
MSPIPVPNLLNKQLTKHQDVSHSFLEEITAHSTNKKFEEKPFNEGNGNVSKQPYKRTNRVLVQKVDEIPIGMETDDYIIDSKKIVCFNGIDHFLCTMYPSPITIDDNKYLSVEHYYQACKLFCLAGPQYAAQLANIVVPMTVKMTTKRILRELKISNSRVEEWKCSDGFYMLQHANYFKFTQNFDLALKLIETGDAILAQSFEADKFYACGLDKEGVKQWATQNEGKLIRIPRELTLANAKYIPMFGNGRNVIGAMFMKIRKDLAGSERIGKYERASVQPSLMDSSCMMDSLSISLDNLLSKKGGSEEEKKDRF